jgi:cytochrome c-type biogenesis protein CcmH
MNRAFANDAIPTTPVDYEVRPLPAATDSRRLMTLVGLAACVTLSSLYLAVRGTEKPVAQAVASHAAPALANAPANAQAPDVQAMVDRLAARLQKEPDNGPGWQMLAKSYAALGRFDDAAGAYGKAVALLPPDAGLLADYADVVAMNQSGSFGGEPVRLVQKALAIDPSHPKALALAGTEAFRRGDFANALRYWNKAIETVPADSDLAVSVRNGIAEAEKRRAASVGQQRQ